MRLVVTAAVVVVVLGTCCTCIGLAAGRCLEYSYLSLSHFCGLCGVSQVWVRDPEFGAVDVRSSRLGWCSEGRSNAPYAEKDGRLR